MERKTVGLMMTDKATSRKVQKVAKTIIQVKLEVVWKNLLESIKVESKKILRN